MLRSNPRLDNPNKKEGANTLLGALTRARTQKKKERKKVCYGNAQIYKVHAYERDRKTPPKPAT